VLESFLEGAWWGGMKSVVITGGTRGVGFGMALAFLRAGRRVVVCGRGIGGVERAVAALGAAHGVRRGDYEQVRALWERGGGELRSC
jgi:NAD(P)-dependent dehydrogenase (short-subunit alcohol dehydrogenase family)